MLVHGTAEDQARWASILRPLAEHFTVYAIDRRGRGQSGDAAAYSLRAEAADLVAVAEAIGGPVHLLTHSYGALCLMEAALLTDHLGKLVLYEPAFPLKGDFYAPGSIDRLEALLSQGDRLGVITAFLRDFSHLSPMELELVTYLPFWPGRVAAAHTIPRELRQIQGYRFHATRFSTVKSSTLLMIGGDSPDYMKDAVEALHSALPNSTIAALPGQQHNAISLAPDLFAREVLSFLLEA
ncbi:MAG TPA: alpha/beta hydrolase [Ktedonobacterales bacterium]|nr:alpha/beta hydrolase [Ktedonobacterales bacterium]